MSDKNLLNEGQIRQFMKLASLEPLASGFVDRLSELGMPPVEMPANRKEDDEDDENLEETRSNVKGGQELESSNQRGHGRGREPVGESADLSGTLKELGLPPVEMPANRKEDESELHATEDELGDMDAEAGQEHDEIEDLEAAEAPGDGRMISVDDFLAALESALEGVMGDEVEIDSDDLAEPDLEMDAELDVADAEIEMGDEPLEEGEDEKNESAEATDDLVEQITKRVAARILKSALAKKN